MEPYRFLFLNVDRVDGFRDAALATDAQAVAQAKTFLAAMSCEGVEVWKAGRFLYHESKLSAPHATRVAPAVAGRWPKVS
jgi:hypothetical protein